MHYYVIPALKNREEIPKMPCYIEKYPMKVIDVVSDFLGVKKDDIVYKMGRATKDIAHARQIVIYILRTKTNLTIRYISTLMMGMDYSGIREAKKALEKKMEQKEYVREQVSLIIDALS